MAQQAKKSATEQPRWGRVGKQKIEDTGPLTKKRMETCDDEFVAAARDFIQRQHKAFRVAQHHAYALHHRGGGRRMTLTSTAWGSSAQVDYPEPSTMQLIERRGRKRDEIFQIAPYAADRWRQLKGRCNEIHTP